METSPPAGLPAGVRDGGRPVVLITAPALAAVSGVSMHVGQLLGSDLAKRCELLHFQVGSEGRDEAPGARLWRVLADPFRLVRNLRRSQANLVHVNSALNARAFWRDLLLMLAARVAGVPIVLQLHGGALPRRFFRGAAAGRALLRCLLALPRRIVTLGHAEAEAWRAFLPRADVQAVPNAIDVEPYRRLAPVGSDAGRRLHVVYLGRLADGKGLPELIRGIASPALARRRPRLSIAGSGPARASLQALADDLGVGRDLRFVGAVRGSDKLELLASADVFALPSHSEGLPYALLEAMAAGAAPLTTPVGAIPDVVCHGEHGVLVPPRDADAVGRALALLDADRQGLDRLRRAARRRALAHYGLARLVDDLDLVYRDATAGNALRACAGA